MGPPTGPTVTGTHRDLPDGALDALLVGIAIGWASAAVVAVLLVWVS